MNILQDAKDQLAAAMATPLQYNDPNEGTHYAIVSIAAALIALAEAQKPQFVQVGKYRFRVENIDTIETVNDTAPSIIVYTGQVGAAELHGPEATAFLQWWNQHVDVVRLDVEGA
jgi:hypothetical protein